MRMNHIGAVVFAFSLAAGAGAFAEPAPEETVQLPALVLTAPRVANEVPVGTFPMPVSGLRFEPQVDLQARNMAEGQADVAIRGGIFENTGFRIGNNNVFDPQTGHYGAELPIAPAMLTGVRVLTGADGAFAGGNAAVGTLEYDWRPIQNRGELLAAAGPNETWRGSLYTAATFLTARSEERLAADFEVARSASNGPIAGGDHEFSRVDGRLQWIRDGAQTDVFAGYQSKFFGWPNLYTPFGWLETDYLKTTLVAVNHREGGATGDFWQVSAFWRRNVDDYEADRTRPGVFNPYQTETRMAAAALEARKGFGELGALHFRAEVSGDEIDSTSLTFGRFDSRTYFKGGLVQEREAPLAGGGALAMKAGAVWAADNREGGMLSPVAEIAWLVDGARHPTRIYAQVAGSSQVPGYTALNSNPAAGLFRGNPNLPRERSTNWELGAATGNAGFQVQGALFFRQERGLTDWTYRNGVTARSANPVDIDTVGLESVVTYQWAHGRVVGGYTWLSKREDYRGAAVDASFYALNFPRQRVTLAVVWRLTKEIEVRVDNEYREQEPNLLRRGTAHAFLSSAAVCWFVPAVRGLELSVQVDNLWNSAFQEVPAVPAAPRQYSVGLCYRW